MTVATLQPLGFHVFALAVLSQSVLLKAATLPLKSQQRGGLRLNSSSEAAEHRRTGTATAVLVMLHPMDCSSAEFQRRVDKADGNFASVLSDAGIDILYPEGHNWSDPPTRLPVHYSLEHEPTSSIEASFTNLLKPLLTELRRSYQKIFVVGHSMGGNMALQLLRLAPNEVDAIVSIHSFLLEDSKVWEELQKPLLPVLLVRAQNDGYIPYEEVQTCYERMKSKGIDVSLKSFSTGDHPLQGPELKHIAEWLAHLAS
mmetsp:Transcript_33468/g.73220  ORF Transcript_33468/g.73220 Transcript_33468/m.73220 type:complete len:257 (+) Transcript_33468:63-833(+)